MPRYAPELECSVEDKASLVALAKSRTAEAYAVERARNHSGLPGSAPNRSAGGNARSRAVNSKIQSSIYAIKH